MGENVLVAEEIVEETVQNTGLGALVESLSGHLQTRVFPVERPKYRSKNQKILGLLWVVTASQIGLVWASMPGSALPWPRAGGVRAVCDWALEDSRGTRLWNDRCEWRPLHTVACAQGHHTLQSWIERPRERACDSFKVQFESANVFFLWFKVHVTKLLNLKTSVIDYNVRAEILSMGMGIDNPEHIEQLKKLYEGAKIQTVEESRSQTL